MTIAYFHRKNYAKKWRLLFAFVALTLIICWHGFTSKDHTEESYRSRRYLHVIKSYEADFEYVNSPGLRHGFVARTEQQLYDNHLKKNFLPLSTDNFVSDINLNTSSNSLESANLTETVKESHENSTCLLPSISEFPPDMFTTSQKKHGAIIFHVFISMYMFAGLAIVCDYYFISSLEVICHKLKLQTDVAGASLMAIGSSAPELFASLIGVFITKGDIGIGTILGSAVFNVLFVLGISGIVASKVLKLAWWPLTRDCLCYAFTLIVLTIVIFDGSVTWKEAAIMLLLYVAYLLLMWYNESIERKFYDYIGDTKTRDERFTTREGERVTWKNTPEENKNGETGHQKEEIFYETDTSESEEDVYPIEEPKKLFEFPTNILDRFTWVLFFPLNAIFFFSIPDIRRRNLRGYVTITFIISILWIGTLTYILVWMVTIIGFTLDIPEAVMGLTLVAFGSSLPDALSSIYVARIGKGDMAVAQALGSNVFDILFGLGLPWLIKTLIYDLDSTIEVQSVGMLVSSFIIFISVICTLAAFHYRNYYLDKTIGYGMLSSYAVFLVVSVLMEIFVWSKYHPPTCKYI
ncbi:sodium/potassium/calcium exchanger 3 isoform X1 [Hydra vulgaris]|uniref:sodium/potassium/calcium exchanger 3 isoform X1 n=1 Tax=Hydra vulgaris TaxID=6087 RepID=UPI0006412105|nr:sodium/potassium/calcium exchanger 3 isoform X1 [Hydra vulgaris]